MLTESLVVVAPIMAPVFVVAAIGFGWARAGMPFDTEFTTSLVSNLAFPCLIVATLAKLEVDPAAFSQMAWAGVLTVLATGAIAAVVLKAFGRSQPVYWPPLVFGNVGNMGLPLCLFARAQGVRPVPAGVLAAAGVR
jgi:predicted permease